MRVILPTGRNCDKWFCDTAFDLLERDVRLFDTSDWAEKKREESPIKNLAAACDESAGLAVITKGLCEACVQDNDNRSIALTLFRGFSQCIGGHWTSDSQMLGKISFEYALLPFVSENSQPPVGIFNEIERFKMPIVTLTTTVHDGDLPSEGKLMELTGDAVLSTIKTSEDGKSVVVRLFNPYAKEIDAGLSFYKELKNAWKCDMAETVKENLDTAGNQLTLSIPAKKVVTVKVEY